MTVVGLDDTDSRERGMCTTYLATRLAEAFADAGGDVERRLLVRLNPAVEQKTRGNAALALHVSLPATTAFEVAREAIPRWAETDDDRTSPGLVVAPGDADDVPEAVAAFARGALREFRSVEAAVETCEAAGYRHAGWEGGRGRIGALAAVGAWAGFAEAEWTYEHVAYRAFDRCGTPRVVDFDSVFAAADDGYPTVWDTVDRTAGEAVCVPHAPGPILYGIRGDDPAACRAVAADIDGEAVDRTATFHTNQGTDAHLRPGRVGAVRDGRAYRVDGVVARPPETRRGGHVFFTLHDAPARGDGARPTRSDPDGAALDCAAFEPTKRFRAHVRRLRAGDRLTVCGEVSEGTLKLEKFAVRELVRTEPAVPRCPDCERSMESAGREQGYRCRDCGTTAPGKVDRPLDRSLDVGWYEVPPRARRHVAKPLVRGGFDAPTHPER